MQLHQSAPRAALSPTSVSLTQCPAVRPSTPPVIPAQVRTKHTSSIPSSVNQRIVSQFIQRCQKTFGADFVHPLDRPSAQGTKGVAADDTAEAAEADSSRASLSSSSSAQQVDATQSLHTVSGVTRGVKMKHVSECTPVVVYVPTGTPRMVFQGMTIAAREVEVLQCIEDEATWRNFYHRLSTGKVLAAIYSHPMKTFTPEWRASTGPQRYGHKGISPTVKTRVRTETLWAHRIAAALRVHLQNAIPAILDVPLLTQGFSLLELDEFEGIRDPLKANSISLDQCMFGAELTKPTLWYMCFTHQSSPILHMQRACNHPQQTWIYPTSGRRVVKPHPTRNQEVPVLASLWTEARRAIFVTRQEPMALKAEQDGVYPSRLTTKLVETLQLSLDKPTRSLSCKPTGSLSSQTYGFTTSSSASSEIPKASYFHPGKVKPLSLAGNVVKKSKTLASPAIGGLRRLNSTLAKLPLVADLGSQIRVVLDELLDNHKEMTQGALDHLGREDCIYVDNDISKLAKMKIKMIVSQKLPSFCPRDPTETCNMDVNLLDHWRQAAKDPDHEAVEWLLHGAPAGILTDIPSCSIFPEYVPEEDCPMKTPDQLWTSDDFVNYYGVEDSQDAATELQRLKASGFVKEFANWPATVRFLGGHEPVLSKIGLIIRERAGKRKVRMVVDSKESGVSGACRKWQLIQLPTILHAVWDHMELLQSSTPGQELEHMIADFKDAFFLIPNKHEERRYFVVQFQNLYYVFLKTAQGSKAAPLTWARVAALITRLTMSVLGTTQARINTYVDDPLVSTIGTKQQRDRCFALAILVWGALGLPLSLTKASRGNAVTWISGTFQNIPGGVRVGIKQDLLTDVLMSVETMLKHNQNRRKDVRSLEGKLSHISSLVPTVKPFLNDLRAAIHSEDSSAPKGKLWTKQVQHVLRWVKALLSGAVGDFSRNYLTDAYHGLDAVAEINLDASPWGLGGYLVLDHQIVSWFSCPVTATEAKILQITIGDASAQQAVEALAALVALRAWLHYWREKPLRVCVRSDSMSTLILVLQLKTSTFVGKGTVLVAREMALDIAMACYQPAIVEHVPGIANVTCDTLSRQFQPGASYALPECLSGITELVLPPRGPEFFRSISPPGTQRAK